MNKGFNLPIPKIVVFTVFLTFLFLFGNLSSGVDSPNLQFYAKEGLGISVGTLGVLFFLLNTFSGVIRVPTGILIDRHGTKRFLTIAYVISVVSLIVPLVWRNWLVLAFAMILSGAASGVMFCSQKFRLAHSTDSRNRSVAYSMLFAFTFLSGFLGPYISGVLMQNYGFHAPMICALAIAAVGMFLSLRLPQIGGKGNPKETTAAVSSSAGSRQVTTGVLSSLKQMGRNVWLITFYKTSFNAIGGVTGLIYALYLRETFDLSYELTGTIMTVLSVPNIVGILLAGRAGSVRARKKLLLLVMINIPLFFLGFRLVSHVIQAIALIIIINLIDGHIVPTMDAILADSARSSQVGLSFGIYDMCMRVGIGLGNVLGGFVVDNFGYVAALNTAGLMSVIPTLLALAIMRTESASR